MCHTTNLKQDEGFVTCYLLEDHDIRPVQGERNQQAPLVCDAFILPTIVGSLNDD